MEFLVIIPAFLVVGLVVMAVRRIVLRRNPPGPPSTDSSVPTFEVVALGLNGTGKTVLLSSMFHQLHVPLDGRPYYLAADPGQQILLSRTLASVIDTTKGWPLGTTQGETRTYSFDCKAQIRNEDVTAFRINYLDYPGELWEDVKDLAALGDLTAKVEAADALLGVLDGVRILQYLQGHPTGQAYLFAGIQPLIAMMSRATCPIYLVVTKWDVVREFGEPTEADDNARLALVTRALMAVPQLRALIERPGLVRIIPVSAVGANFAKVDPTGSMLKRPDGQFDPIDVEVPLAAAIPDVFARIEESLDASTKAELSRAVQERLKLTPADSLRAVAFVLSRPLGVAVRGTVALTLGKDYGNDVVSAALDWIARPIQQKAVDVHAYRGAAEQRMALVQQARRLVLNDMHTTVIRFEARVPASRPGAGRRGDRGHS